MLPEDRTRGTRGNGGGIREQRSQAAAPFVCPVTVIAGPPGSGKSSYVAGRQRWGDLVLDLDAVASIMLELGVLKNKPDTARLIWK